MIDHTLVLDEILSPDECRLLIAESQSAGLIKDQARTYYGYSHRDYTIQDNFTHPILSRVNSHMLAEYRKQYPEINYVDTELLWSGWRFKHFEPGNSFGAWHAEHNYQIPHRILCCMLYLTTHPEGTEFMHYKTVVSSQQGRAIMFPTFFTHTHRGQATSTDRYIMSNYIYFSSKPKVIRTEL